MIGNRGVLHLELDGLVFFATGTAEEMETIKRNRIKAYSDKELVIKDFFVRIITSDGKGNVKEWYKDKGKSLWRPVK